MTPMIQSSQSFSPGFNMERLRAEGRWGRCWVCNRFTEYEVLTPLVGSQVAPGQRMGWLHCCCVECSGVLEQAYAREYYREMMFIPAPVDTSAPWNLPADTPQTVGETWWYIWQGVFG